MSKVKLVRKSEAKESKPSQAPVRQFTCTNWASEFRAEKANQPSPQSQWRMLFQEAR